MKTEKRRNFDQIFVSLMCCINTYQYLAKNQSVSLKNKISSSLERTKRGQGDLPCIKMEMAAR